MADASERPDRPSPHSSGVVGDLRRLKTDGSASVAELREFLGRMQGKSPQEMLGLVAKSGLTRSVVLAAVLFIVLLAALTVIPYALSDRAAASPKTLAAEPAAPESTAAESADRSPEQQAATTSPTAPSDGEADDRTNADRAVDALGIGETRSADSDTNPLEDKLDNLLDGVD